MHLRALQDLMTEFDALAGTKSLELQLATYKGPFSTTLANTMFAELSISRQTVAEVLKAKQQELLQK
jgi:hypothetical protein